MSSFLATFATWGPSAYYSLGVAHSLFTPSSILPKDPSKHLAIKILPDIFRKVEKLRKDIIFLGDPHALDAVAIGTNFGPAAVLVVNPDLANLDGDELNFFCKYELSHIMNNDDFTAGSLAAIASAVSTCAVPFLTSRLPAWAAPIAFSLPYFVGTNVLSFVKGMGEQKAFNFALEHATDEELADVEKFVRANIKVNEGMHHNYPLFFTKEGNVRSLFADSTKFSLTKSLLKIQFECQKRNVLIDNTPDQVAKMREYMNFHLARDKKMFKLT